MKIGKQKSPNYYRAAIYLKKLILMKLLNLKSFLPKIPPKRNGRKRRNKGMIKKI